MSVTRKTEIGPIDGTLLKRMFWSIISDYDLKTGICELVDNAIDLWTASGKKKLRLDLTECRPRPSPCQRAREGLVQACRALAEQRGPRAER